MFSPGKENRLRIIEIPHIAIASSRKKDIMDLLLALKVSAQSVVAAGPDSLIPGISGRPHAGRHTSSHHLSDLSLNPGGHRSAMNLTHRTHGDRSLGRLVRTAC